METRTRKYLTKQAAIRNIAWKEKPGQDLRQVVVIPAYEEYHYLPNTLESIAACDPPGTHKQTAVLVVVNNPAGRSPNPPLERAFRDNQRTLDWIRDGLTDFPYPLGWIDASSPRRELPGKGGVGMARRIGCDSALAHIAENQPANGPRHTEQHTVFLNLDADTIVDRTYLQAPTELIGSGCGGGAILFEHQRADAPRTQRAIDCYELYLHHYVLGLELAHSPYAFHTVGSTMLCTGEAYVKAGGMPRKRLAGEDFYFMQNLARTSGVCTLASTTVRPSARTSHRVPFGTGPRIAAFVTGEQPEFTVFDPAAFDALGQTRKAVCNGLALGLNAKAILCRVHSRAAKEFLLKAGFPKVAESFTAQFADTAQRTNAFDTWFDGLATFRFMRHLGDTEFPPVDLVRGWHTIAEKLNITLAERDPARILQQWRQHARKRHARMGREPSSEKPI